MMNIDLNNSKMMVQEPSSDKNEIHFCDKCGCENFEKTDIKYEQQYESEYALICKQCHNYVNEFYYGFFRNEKSEKYIIEEKRRIRQKKIKRLNELVERKI